MLEGIEILNKTEIMEFSDTIHSLLSFLAAVAIAILVAAACASLIKLDKIAISCFFVFVVCFVAKKLVLRGKE